MKSLVPTYSLVSTSVSYRPFHIEMILLIATKAKIGPQVVEFLDPGLVFLAAGPEGFCFGPPRKALTPETLSELFGEHTGIYHHQHPS